ncbi:MAG: hypothetical protein DMG13_27470 [Acidobacteria bacterium]|nr:MAG: hypothetical protein DMG13_27470 [Acidobacteriota bacterium]
MWRRVAALVIVLILPTGGLWIARCGQTALDETNMPADCASGMCPMHHGGGEYCPTHDQQQQNDSCPCQMSSCTQIQIVAAANLAVTQETTLLLVTIKSTPAALPLMHILHSTILESPTPPPRGM